MPACDFKMTNPPWLRLHWRVGTLGRMSCGPGPRHTPWLHPGSGLGRDRPDHELRHAVLSFGKKSPCPEPARSAAYFVRVLIKGVTGGASTPLRGQKPSFVLSVTHMMKLFGNLEWYYISPGSNEAVTTSLMNLSPPFNNVAIYRLGLYWIDCRSCTKAHSVSAMKLQRDSSADQNHSVQLHIIKYYNLLCFSWLHSLLNWKANGILLHLWNFLRSESWSCEVQAFSSLTD